MGAINTRACYLFQLMQSLQYARVRGLCCTAQNLDRYSLWNKDVPLRCPAKSQRSHPDFCQNDKILNIHTCEKIPDGSFWCSVATLFHPYFVNNAARAGLKAKSEEIVRKKRGYNSRFCKAGDVDA